MEKLTFNLQLSYDDLEDFAVVANVNYELVPNLVITPEISYFDNFDYDDFDMTALGLPAPRTGQLRRLIRLG